MERWVVVTSILVLYLGVTLTIGLMAGRRASKSVQGYVAGDRQFGLLVMYFVTGASVFSAFAFLGGPGWAYSQGAAAYYILAYGVIGMGAWYWLGPRIAGVGRRHGFVTQAQLLMGRFPSRALSLTLAVLAVLAFIPYVTLQMSGAAIVIQAVTENHVPIWLGAALSYGVVVLYVLLGGVAAVGWTNTFQGIFMLAIAWTLGLYLPIHLYGGVGEMFNQIEAARPELLSLPGLTAAGQPWGWGGFSSAILVSAIGLMMWPHLFMKAFTAKDDRTLRRTVVLFPTFQLFLIPVFLIGFAGVLYPGSPPRPDFILPYLILESNLSPIVVGLFCAGALSASMSTGDALLHAAASVAIEDGVHPFAPGLSDKSQQLWMKIVLIGVALIAYGFAISGSQSLVVLLLTAYGIICQFAPPILAALYWKRATTPGVLTGLISGSATALWFYFQGGRPFELHEGLLGLMVHIPVLVAVSLMTQPQDPAHVARFMGGGTEEAPR
ncbi:MAG: sodium:solute symporter family protein [Gemmatimonadota bacterium]